MSRPRLAKSTEGGRTSLHSQRGCFRSGRIVTEAVSHLEPPGPLGRAVPLREVTCAGATCGLLILKPVCSSRIDRDKLNPPHPRPSATLLRPQRFPSPLLKPYRTLFSAELFYYVNLYQSCSVFSSSLRDGKSP